MTIRHMQHIALAALMIMTLWGCGSSSDTAPALNAAGEHPSDWYTAHRQAFSVAYLSDSALQCRECHGLDLGSTDPLKNDGGIARVGCILTDRNGQACHAGGHPPRAVPHTIPFTQANLHGPAAKADLAGCQICHGTTGGAGTNPRFTTTIGSLVNGCEDCHKTGTAHPPVDPAKLPGYPASWNGHATAGNLTNSCTLCHGISYEGGSGPPCANCHNAPGAVIPPVAGQCISCHAKPPATGGHATHNSLSSLANVCTACHLNAGSGTARHGSRGFGNVSTAIPVEYHAKTGAARVTGSLTCQNVACHGGVTTPPWSTGSINSSTECILCHTEGTTSGTPQNNSYYSGEHGRHVNSIGLPCTDCHDMTVTSNGNSHFSDMATPAFELAPALTIRTPVNYSGGSCSPGNNPAQFSLGVCHGSENW